MNSIDKINKLSKPDFISIFGNIFEKTEWIAQKSYDSKPYKNYDELSIDGLLNEINSLKKQLKHLEDLLKSKKSGYTQATKLFKK